jgi:hypothetical protein
VPGDPWRDFIYRDDRLWASLGEQEYDPHTKKTIYGAECRLEDNCMFYTPIVVGGGKSKPAVCPYGKPGDRLWVRETWQQTFKLRGSRDQRVVSADPTPGTGRLHYAADELVEDPPKWRTSIHMPRWASRINLDITGVRIERLQEIDDWGAIEEGIYAPYWHKSDGNSDGYFTEPEGMAVDAFRDLWESINGPDSWSANPWVWVVEFKRA